MENTIWTKTRLLPILLILFSSALFFFDLGKRDLWAPDEPTYAQVAREMWISKDFILPHLNGEIYSQKPPLLFWLIILFSLPFGDVTELSARLPSALAGIGCMLATFSMGRRFVSNRVGYLAALILPTSALFLWMSHRVAFDVVLTFFVIMSLIYFLKGQDRLKAEGGTPQGGMDKQGLSVSGGHGQTSLSMPPSAFFWLFYVFLALAVLTKGPAGFIPTFITILLYLAVQKKLRLLRKMELGKGFAIFCLIVFGWVIAASIKGGHGYMNEILFRQNIGRFSEPWDHSQPFYYFFINFPLSFLPWTFFIPGAFIYALFEKEKRREMLFPILWFAAFFGFFTISSGKRNIYILPLYPAASIMVAWFLDSFVGAGLKPAPTGRVFRWIGYLPGYILYGILLILSIALPLYAPRYFHGRGVLLAQRIGESANFFGGQYALTCVSAAGGAILAIVLLYLKKPLHALMTTFLFTLLTFSLAKELVIPVINDEKSSKSLCQKASNIMRTNDVWAIYGFFKPTYLYYTDRNRIEVIQDVSALNSLLASTNRVLLVIQEKDFKKVVNEITSPVHILEKDGVGHRKILLVSNKKVDSR
ncbi:MAG TPA: phospholipid carrier-dependent glycosyltransferase [Candidatus Brocadiia bacterium]|nr:glycosyltransferase family 39 protein [Candidatus Brocadiales bacterium]